MALDKTQGKPLDQTAAGYERAEQAKINADLLAMKTEELEGVADVHAVHSSMLEPINEIVQHFDEYNTLAVSNADPMYEYAWVFTGAHGVMVTAKQAIRVRDADGSMVPCWEVVSGAMQEAAECKDVNGYRRVGDVLLMRCRKDRYYLLRKYQAQRAANHSQAATGEIRQREMEMRAKGIPIRLVEGPLTHPMYRRMAQQAAAHGIARAKFEEMLRNGSLPGMTPQAAAAHAVGA